MPDLELLSVEELFSMLPPYISRVEDYRCECGSKKLKTFQYDFKFDMFSNYNSKNIPRKVYNVNYVCGTKTLGAISHSLNLNAVLIKLIYELISLGYEDKLLPIWKVD